jgi:hypothetical protein
MNTNISAEALRKAAAIRDQIESLQAQVAAILSGTAPRRGRKPGKRGKKAAKTTAKAGAPAKRRKKRKLSPEARARIVAAVKARWARQKAGK